MRILHVIQELGTGGAERILISAYRGARSAGHEVFVAAAPGPLASEIEGEVFPLPLVRRKPWRLPPAALAVRRAVRATRPDVIHAYNPTMALAAGLATRRPGLVNLQGVAEEDWPATVRLVRLSRLAPVACGPGVAAALEEHGVTPFATVPNAVGPAPPPGERLAAQKLVVAVGRLVEQKNHELAIRAITQVPGATLAIVGDGPLRPQLQRLAAEIGASVIFTGVRGDARALMGAADVVVMPSRWEGLPLSALEALASGTPLVATNVRGLRELLTDGENALLVSEEPDALAAAIRRVLEDRELAARLSEAGRRVEGAGSDEALVAGFLQVYERLAA